VGSKYVGDCQMIVVIDYGMGNLHSVAKALEMAGGDVVVSHKASDIRKAERIVLPGVGTFSEGMKSLKELNLIEVLSEEVLKGGKPFLGICLGMHLLANDGYENGHSTGLGWISAEVKTFSLKDKDLKVPHMGWNDVSVLAEDSAMFAGIHNQSDFYFVHCCNFIAKGNDMVVATYEYGDKFVAAIQSKNIFATQFHPEKSQEDGLRLLENFIGWNP
jgi:imidazole glycerol-phosphate synthase subunit HisH